MSGAEFNQSKNDQYAPTWGGIDWRAALAARLAIEQIEQSDPIWFKTDGLEMQVTQENTVIYINDTHDALDAIAIVDPRDEKPFWWFRGVMGSESFDELVEHLSWWSMCVDTLYPLESITTVYLQIQTQDVQGIEVDGLPDTFKIDGDN